MYQSRLDDNGPERAIHLREAGMLTRDVWDLSERDFPRAGPIDLQLRFLLRYAILAPSVKNTQPWSFTVASNRVHLAAARNRDLPVADPHQRELYISLGCALENLLVAAEHFGFSHEVTYFPTPEDDRLVATVAFSTGGTVAQLASASRSTRSRSAATTTACSDQACLGRPQAAPGGLQAGARATARLDRRPAVPTLDRGVHGGCGSGGNSPFPSFVKSWDS